MKKHLLGGIGNFYKANLHMHTTISDGQMSPEEAKQKYMEQGYSILAYTDHEIIVPHNELSDENFLAITSYEASITRQDPRGVFEFCKTYHLNLFAKDKNAVVSPCFNVKNVWHPNSLPFVTDEMRKVEYPLVYSVDGVNDFIAKANAAGFLVAYNHPVWSLQDYDDYADLKGLWGVEVYNHLSTVVGHPDTEIPFVTLLRKGERLLPLATDDTHWRHTAFGGFCMIEAEKLDYDTVLSAMERGDLYSSNGPKISEIFVEDRKLTVRCSAASQITLNTERRLAYSQRGEGLTEATFDLSVIDEQNALCSDEQPTYIRITVTDAQGKQAWSRAYFKGEF